MTIPTPSEAEALAEEFFQRTKGLLGEFGRRGSRPSSFDDAARAYLAALPPQDSSGDARAPLKVEQEDREAAATAYARSRSADQDEHGAILNGHRDDHPLVQAYACERLTHLSRQDRPDPQARQALAAIMREYRHLMGEETPEIRDAMDALASRSAPDGWVLETKHVEALEARMRRLEEMGDEVVDMTVAESDAEYAALEAVLALAASLSALDGEGDR